MVNFHADCSGETLFNFDSVASGLKRPGRLCCTSFNQEDRDSDLNESDYNPKLKPYQAGLVYVADEDSIKQYRYA